MRFSKTLATAIGACAMLLSSSALALDTYNNKDTIQTLGTSTTGNNFYFWTSSATHTCGGTASTKWRIDLNDTGDESMAKLAEMAFLSGLNVAMDYSCSGSTALVGYIKVYR